MLGIVPIAAAQEQAPEPAENEPVDADRIEELIEQLAHRDFDVRERATDRLRQIGMLAVPRLRRARESEDPEVRMRAARILNSVEWGLPDDAPEELVNALRNFKSLPSARHQPALKLVRDRMGANALPFLLARAEDGNRGYSDYAVDLISQMDPNVVKPFLRDALTDPKNAWVARLHAWAHDPPEPVPVPAAPGEMTLDAERKDWAGVEPLPRPLKNGKPGSMRMAWSEAGLHFFYETADGQIAVTENQPWLGDSLELFLDPGLDRSFKRETPDMQLGFMPAGKPGPGKLKIIYGSRRVINARENLRCVWTKTENGYAMEGIVPAEALESMKMKPGQKLGMNYAINNRGRPVEQFACDKNENDGWESAVLWAPLQLAAPEEKDEETEAQDGTTP
jgi:hypothetical protein